uniref:HAD family hydrolase n=1 Tax=Thermofilum pendens TaxID=2269 RepID=A0A7J3X5F5_THEPE
MTTRLRAVFLDVGNTLVRDVGFAQKLAEKLSSTLYVVVGLRVDQESVLKAWVELDKWAQSGVELWDLARVMLLARKLGLTPSARLAELLYAAVLEAYLEGFEVEPAASSVIRELKEMGLRVGLLTNVGSYDVVKLRMQKAGVLDYLDVVVASQAFSWRKPSRRIFEVACFLAGVEPVEALHVGDDPQADIAGARAAGLRAVQVLKYAAERSPAADAWIYSIEELPGVVRAIMSS